MPFHSTMSHMGENGTENLCRNSYIYENSTMTSLSQSERCSKIGLEICKNDEDIFNFYALNYCLLKESIPLLLLSSIIVIFFIFRYVAIVVDEYCAEGITKISTWLNFSQSLAGVTLLAFANGAGDVLTAIVASGSEGGIFYNVGSIFGAGLFVCCVVVGGAILKKGVIEYDRMIVFRDISIYILAGVLTLVFGYLGEINWVNSVIFLAVYVAQVTIVLVQDMTKMANQKTEEKFDESKSKLSDSITLEKMEKMNLLTKKENKGRLLWRKAKTAQKMRGMLSNLKDSEFLGLVRVRYLLKQAKKAHKEGEFEGNADFDGLEEEESLVWQILDFPFTVAAFLTLLPSSKEHYSKYQALLWCFTGTLFEFLIIFRLDWSDKILYGYIGFAAINFLIYLISAIATPEEVSEGVFKWTVLNSVISSVFWMYILIEILMSLMDTIGMVLDLDPSFLGFTILAIGNALPDALSTLALFDIPGQGVLALSGAYNGQLFGLLVGFGLGNLKLTLSQGPQDFRLFDPSKLKERMIGIVVIGLSLFVLVSTWIITVSNGFKVERGFGGYLIVIYALFFAGAVAYNLMSN